MEISAGKKHVAVIERCMMSEAGLRHLFASPAMKSYHFHFFNSHKAFVEAQKKTPFFSVIRYRVCESSDGNVCFACMRCH